MSNVLSDLIWVQTDCVNVISRRTVARKLNASCADNKIVRALRDKNRSRANCVPIYGDLYQNLQWSVTFNLKVVTHLNSASEASCDVLNMATIIGNCPLIKAINSLCWYGHIYPTRTFFNIISIILVI